MFYWSSTLLGAVTAKRTYSLYSITFPNIYLPPITQSINQNQPTNMKTNKTKNSLAPKYEELAALYTENPSLAPKVTIAKVDATANDVPDEIQGFPTIKLFPAGSKDTPILYSGSRTIEDLVAFIKENGKYHADAYEGKSNETDDDEGDVVAGVKDGAQEVVGEAAAAATEKGGSATKEAKEKGGSAAEVAKDKGGSATEVAKDKGGSATEVAKDKGGSATEVAKDKGGSATEVAKDKGGSATEVAKDKGASATEQAKEKGESASEGVKATVKSKIVEAAEAVKTVVGDSDDAHDEHDEL